MLYRTTYKDAKDTYASVGAKVISDPDVRHAVRCVCGPDRKDTLVITATTPNSIARRLDLDTMAELVSRLTAQASRPIYGISPAGILAAIAAIRAEILAAVGVVAAIERQEDTTPEGYSTMLELTWNRDPPESIK